MSVMSPAVPVRSRLDTPALLPYYFTRLPSPFRAGGLRPPARCVLYHGEYASLGGAGARAQSAKRDGRECGRAGVGGRALRVGVVSGRCEWA